MPSQTVTMQNFESTIDAHPLVLLDFWAGWCGPCKTLAPAFEQLAEAHPDILFGKVDIEAATDLAEAFQVRTVPTLMGFRAGELVFEVSGLPLPNQLLDLIEKLRSAPLPEENP